MCQGDVAQVAAHRERDVTVHHLSAAREALQASWGVSPLHEDTSWKVDAFCGPASRIHHNQPPKVHMENLIALVLNLLSRKACFGLRVCSVLHDTYVHVFTDQSISMPNAVMACGPQLFDNDRYFKHNSCKHLDDLLFRLDHQHTVINALHTELIHDNSEPRIPQRVSTAETSIPSGPPFHHQSMGLSQGQEVNFSDLFRMLCSRIYTKLSRCG